MEETNVFEQLEQVWNATQLLQKAIGYSYVEALGETLQNLLQDKRVQQVDGEPADEVVMQLEECYRSIRIEEAARQDIRRWIQYCFLKAAKEDQLQANHQMTPEAIALLIAFMIQVLSKQHKELTIGDFAVGSANLLSIVVDFLEKEHSLIDAYGIDNDEVLLHLASQSMALQKQSIRLMLQDGLRPLYVPPLDIAVSDLPIGYYPVDEIAGTFETKSDEGHSYAHHLLIEQHIRYLKDGGFGIFVVPTTLFESPQAPHLLKYVQEVGYIQALLNLPMNLFKASSLQKAIFIVQKKGNGAKQAKQVLLGNIPELKQKEKFAHFTDTFAKWSKDLKRK